MKITTTLLVFVLSLPLIGVQAHHDGDPIDDDVERLSCGAPTVQLVVALANGALGSCNGLDYENSAFGSSVDCMDSQCQMTSFWSQQSVDAVPTEDTPLPPNEIQGVGPLFFTDLRYVWIEGYYVDDGKYCLGVEIKNANDPPLVCLGLGSNQGLVPETGRIELLPFDKGGSTPPVEEGDAGTVPGQNGHIASFEVRVIAHYDQDHLHQRITVGDEVDAWEPVDSLDAQEMSWYAANPDETSLEIQYTLYDRDGVELDARSARLPYLGQAIAAMAR